MKFYLFQGAHVTLALTLATLLAVPQAWGQKTKITKENKSEFQKLPGKGKYVCRTDEDGNSELFTFRGKKLKPGTAVKVFRRDEFRANLQAKIDRWQAKIERLRGKSKRSKSALRRLEKKVQKALLQLDDADVRFEQCTGRDPSGDGDDDDDDVVSGNEFLGDSTSLAPYRNELTENEISHILDKVAFGGSDELRSIGRNQGLSALVDALVDGLTTTAEDQAFDAQVEAWTSKGYYFSEVDPAYGRIYTTDALQIGQYYRFIYSRNPIREWMLFKLSEHYAVNLNAIDFSFSQFTHYGLKQHWDTLRSHSLGNLRSLAHAMFTDPAMGAWLDNPTNQAGALNQNYLRELLELFTLGTADPVTKVAHYDQDTIDSATIAVTGYDYTQQADPVTGQSVVDVHYVSGRHDNSPVVAFTGIPGAEINQSMLPGEFLDHVLDNHPGSPRYLGDRFGGFLLYPGLPEVVVAALAANLKTNNYELVPFLKLVLRSSAMFSTASRNVCVSSPIEHIVKLARRTLHEPLETSGEQGQRNYWMLYSLLDGASEAGQRLFEPPSVFAWDAACNINRSGNISYGEEWVTAQRLLNRSRACGSFMNSLNWTGYDFVTGFGISDDMSAQQIVQTVARNLYDTSVPDDQLSLITSFLTTARDGNGASYEIAVDLSAEWWVKLKLPRLACLLGSLVDVNLK